MSIQSQAVSLGLKNRALPIVRLCVLSSKDFDGDFSAFVGYETACLIANPNWPSEIGVDITFAIVREILIEQAAAQKEFEARAARIGASC